MRGAFPTEAVDRKPEHALRILGGGVPCAIIAGMPKNVLGQPLHACCADPLAGFYRDGFCRTGTDDLGRHTVCAVMTQQFLEFTRVRGNDLSTPMPAAGFPGLRPGDRWCLCVERWAEALEAGVAPPVLLQATAEQALEIVSFDDLFAHALV